MTSFFLNQLPSGAGSLFPRGSTLHLQGLTSRPDINGCAVTCGSLDPTTGRYAVTLADTQESIRVRPECLTWPPGAWPPGTLLTLHGLTGSPHLNGATVTSLPPSNIPGEERCGVAYGSERTLHIKHANLRPLPALPPSPGLELETLILPDKLLNFALSSYNFGEALFDGPLGRHLATSAGKGLVFTHFKGSSNLKSVMESCSLTPQSKYLIVPHSPLHGCFHAKFLVLVYPHVLRLCITSANFTPSDFLRKTNSAWVQDFPLKLPSVPLASALAGRLFPCKKGRSSGSGSSSSSSSGGGGCSSTEECYCRKCLPAASPFETDLLRFLTGAATAVNNNKPGETPAIELKKQVEGLVSHVSSFDFSSARCDLLASTPGDKVHSGHAGLRTLLRHRGVQVPPGAALVAQSSSVGSLNEGFLHALCHSMCGPDGGGEGSDGSEGRGSGSGIKRQRESASSPPPPSSSSAAAAAGPPRSLLFLYPTVSTVVGSNEGHAAGDILFLKREHLDQVPLGVYDARASGRELAVPHMKTFAAVSASSSSSGASSSSSSSGGGGGAQGALQVRIHWLLTGSHNLSAAALGGSGGRAPLSWELGVVFTPQQWLTGARCEARALRSGALAYSPFTLTPAQVEAVEAVGEKEREEEEGGEERETGEGREMRRHPVVFVPQWGPGGAPLPCEETAALKREGGGLCVPLPVPFLLPGQYPTGGGAGGGGAAASASAAPPTFYLGLSEGEVGGEYASLDAYGKCKQDYCSVGRNGGEFKRCVGQPDAGMRVGSVAPLPWPPQ